MHQYKSLIMPQVSKQRAFDQMQSYRSRYAYMMDSLSMEDKANAEACRLGCQCWQDIARLIGDPAGHDFDSECESIMSEYNQKWIEYTKTGISVNDVEDLAADLREQHAAEMRARTEQGKQVDDPPKQNDQGSNQSNRNRQKNRSGQVDFQQSLPKSIPATPKINQEMIDHINPEAMKIVLAEIRTDLGINPDEPQFDQYGQIIPIEQYS